MPMALVPINGSRPIPLDKAIVFFGRGQECDVVLAASRKISRKHCCVVQIDDRYFVRDLGSMNGVKINGAQVDREMLLQAGDQLLIGDQAFKFAAVGKGKVASPPATQGESNAKAKGKPTAKGPDPYLVSGDIPIAIPDEDEDFLVENTNAQQIPLAEAIDSDDEIIQLQDDDLFD